MCNESFQNPRSLVSYTKTENFTSRNEITEAYTGESEKLIGMKGNKGLVTLVTRSES